MADEAVIDTAMPGELSAEFEGGYTEGAEEFPTEGYAIADGDEPLEAMEEKGNETQLFGKWSFADVSVSDISLQVRKNWNMN
mmetsp:Transcript_10963/g.24145  ORF Transcript_10963/g.24145 Transcript_10963/m.24145 type:complete len:82 (-) Transcript_10963:1145-1390(-)